MIEKLLLILVKGSLVVMILTSACFFNDQSTTTPPTNSQPKNGITFSNNSSTSYGWDVYGQATYISVAPGSSTEFTLNYNSNGDTTKLYLSSANNYFTLTCPQCAFRNGKYYLQGTNSYNVQIAANAATSGNLTDQFEVMVENENPNLGDKVQNSIYVKIYPFVTKSVNNFYSIYDPLSTSTNLATTIFGLDAVTNNVNSIFKQAVIGINQLTGTLNLTPVYDQNNNGKLDIYFPDTVSNPEYTSATSQVQLNSVIYVHEIRFNCRVVRGNYLDTTFNPPANILRYPGSGDDVVTIEAPDTVLLKQNSIYILGGPSGQNAERIKVLSINGTSIGIETVDDQGYILPPDGTLRNYHSSNETIYDDVAGFEGSKGTSYLTFVTDAAGSKLLNAACHELGHVVGWSDLDTAHSNLMYNSVNGWTGTLLQYTSQLTTGGKYEQQWDLVHP